MGEGVDVITVVNKTMSGGYRFNLESRPNDRMVELELPPTVVIPLKQGFGCETKLLVEVGEDVAAGQIIGGDDQSTSSPVHATVNGRVESLSRLEGREGTINAVIIKADGTAGWQPLADHGPHWQHLSRREIEKLLYSSGVSSLDGKGIPTSFKTSSIPSGEVEHLIVQGIEDSPYGLSLSALLDGQRYSHLIEGMEILRKIMPGASMNLAINSERQHLIQELFQASEDLEWLRLYALPPKYPQGDDQVLARSLLGVKGRSPASAKRVVVLSVATVLHVHDAVVEGKPLIERTVGLSGPGWHENLHLKVRVGTPVEDITSRFLKPAGHYRLIPNNLLTDEAITDLSFPVDRSLSSLVTVKENTTGGELLDAGRKKCSCSQTFLSALNPLAERICSTNTYGEERPCIFCGYCEEVCPVGLIPHLLDKHVTRNLITEDLIKHGIFNCVECNLCSFVCPSKIPVARHIKLGQQKLADYGFTADPEEEMVGGCCVIQGDRT